MYYYSPLYGQESCTQLAPLGVSNRDVQGSNTLSPIYNYQKIIVLCMYFPFK